jgi:TPR repeat protein
VNDKTDEERGTETYYPCCGKSICIGCVYSFHESGNHGNCPYCNAETLRKTNGERVEELMKRVEANDPGSIYLLGNSYCNGQLGLLQDRGKAIELYARAAALGSSQAHFELGNSYREGGDLKKAKFHNEAAAMAGHDDARYNLGCMEYNSGKQERAVKHWTIAASAGDYDAMHVLREIFEEGIVSRETIDSTLTAYNNSCVEMRSEARDAAIRLSIARIGAR